MIDDINYKKMLSELSKEISNIGFEESPKYEEIQNRLTL